MAELRHLGRQLLRRLRGLRHRPLERTHDRFESHPNGTISHAGHLQSAVVPSCDVDEDTQRRLVASVDYLLLIGVVIAVEMGVACWFLWRLVDASG